MCSIYHIETGEKAFWSSYFVRFVSHFFSDRAKQFATKILCSVSLLFALLEKKTQKNVSLRSTFILLYSDFWFDVTKFKFIMKYSRLKCCWVFVYFCSGHRNNFPL